MATIYIQEARASLDYEPANGTLHEGDFVTREDGGGVHPFDPANDSSIDGIIPHAGYGDHIAEHDYDWGTVQDHATYEGDGTPTGSDSVPIQPMSLSDVFVGTAIEDESLAAPSFSRNTVVGVVNINGRPRIVEDGYSDGASTPTTYSESDGNLLELGRVNEEVNDYHGEYGKHVEVRVDRTNPFNS